MHAQRRSKGWHIIGMDWDNIDIVACTGAWMHIDEQRIGGLLLLDPKTDESGGGSHRGMGFVRVDIMTLETMVWKERT